MKVAFFATLLATLCLLAPSPSFAERGGGGGGARGPGGPGGGGAPRGGSPGPSRPNSGPQRGPGGPGGGGYGEPSRGGAAPHNSGGLGGGLSNNNSKEREPGRGEGPGSMSPFAPGGAPGARPGTANGGVGTRPGVGGPASGVGVRPGVGAGAPGVGAGGVGGPASGIGVRPGVGAGAPGVGAGGVGGPASGIGVRPGVGAGAPGVGAGGIGGPASGIGVLPGAGAGRPGVPAAGYAAGYAYGYGTRHVADDALAEQTVAVRAASANYATYNAAIYANYANAWPPANLTNASLYSHPGYGALANGLKMGNQPVTYDYGGNVVVQQDAVYVNGEAAGTPQQYTQQAAQLAAAGQTAQPSETGKWLPLGVFALVEGDATNSNDVFQLAVNQQGILRGNYHNVSSDQMEPISGSVDKDTQRAAWTIGKDTAPVYEAGVLNLTKDATPILIHVGDGQTRQLNLIRLEQPQQP